MVVHAHFGQLVKVLEPIEREMGKRCLSKEEIFTTRRA